MHFCMFTDVLVVNEEQEAEMLYAHWTILTYYMVATVFKFLTHLLLTYVLLLH